MKRDTLAAVRFAGFLLTLAACANASKDSGGDGGAGGDGGGGDTVRACPAGDFALNVGADGQITCGPLAAPMTAALTDRCSTYLGWRDDCDGCTTEPLKWGHVGTASCMNGAGADNTCTTADLGDGAVQLFGLNLDGDMDGNDKLYGSLHCTTVEPTAGALAPCKPDERITGVLGSSFTCGPIAPAVVDYVRASCTMYLGWQDGCDGCSTVPGKWGRAGDDQCQNGAGGDNTCSTANLGAQSINLFGLNPDGDVDGNDKLHIGMHCTAPAATAPVTSSTVCPPGHFVTATAADGSFTCENPAPQIAEHFIGRCALYFGWRDGCDGCGTPPAKFGRVGVGSCTLGAGADDTCTKFPLTDNVDLFGLSPDGDVDGNDTLYLGFRCQ